MRRWRRQGIHGNEVQTLLARESARSATEAQRRESQEALAARRGATEAQRRESQEALAARRGATDTWSAAPALSASRTPGSLSDRLPRWPQNVAQSGIDALDDFRLSQKKLWVHFAASSRDAVAPVLGVRWEDGGNSFSTILIMMN